MNVSLPTDVTVRQSGQAAGAKATVEETRSDPFASFLAKEGGKGDGTSRQERTAAREVAAQRWHARTQMPNGHGHGDLDKRLKNAKDEPGLEPDAKPREAEEEEDPRLLLQQLIHSRPVEKGKPDAAAAEQAGAAPTDGADGGQKNTDRVRGRLDALEADAVAAAPDAAASDATADVKMRKPATEPVHTAARDANALTSGQRSGDGGAAPERAPGGAQGGDGAEAATRTDRAASGEASRRSGQDTASTVTDQPQARVTIVSTQTIAPPVAAAPSAPMSDTGAALVARLADGPLTQYVSDTQATTLATASEQRPVTTLKLNLHPAELGQVTITMTSRGDHLSIEASVDTNEARNRLTHDRDAIVTALRGMGYDIDRITVQQSQNTGASPGGAGREGSFGASQDNRGERQPQSSGREAGRQNGEQHAQRENQRSGRADGAGSGVYI